ncbi:MAG: hypothetical protein RSA02_04635 [Bacteroidales bacterium]
MKFVRSYYCIMESTEVLKILLSQEIVSYFDIVRIEDDEIDERIR